MRSLPVTMTVADAAVIAKALATIPLAAQIDHLWTVGSAVVERQVAGSLARSSRLEGDADRARTAPCQAGAAGVGLREVARDRHPGKANRRRALVGHFQNPGTTAGANFLSTEFQFRRRD